MSDFTFLTKEQCVGSEKLGVLEKRGLEAKPTDFAILLGCDASRVDSLDDGSSLKRRTGSYWTSSKSEDRYDYLIDWGDLDSYNYSYLINYDGGLDSKKNRSWWLWCPTSLTIFIN